MQRYHQLSDFNDTPGGRDGTRWPHMIDGHVLFSTISLGINDLSPSSLAKANVGLSRSTLLAHAVTSVAMLRSRENDPPGFDYMASPR